MSVLRRIFSEVDIRRSIVWFLPVGFHNEVFFLQLLLQVFDHFLLLRKLLTHSLYVFFYAGEVAFLPIILSCNGLVQLLLVAFVSPLRLHWGLWLFLFDRLGPKVVRFICTLPKVRFCLLMRVSIEAFAVSD